jgi:D-amino-acid dehydrogenase
MQPGLGEKRSMLEVAVIGGGIVGASTAYHLVRRGARVTLIDRADAGQATLAGAGILPALAHFSGSDGMLPLLMGARAHLPELVRALADEGQSDTGYSVVGSLHVAVTEDERGRLEDLARAAVALREAGLGHVGAVAALSALDARRLFPPLGERVLGAVYCAGAARIDGRRLLAALRAAFCERGGRWRRGHADLVLRADRVSHVTLETERVAVDAVVIAGGAWSREVAARAGVDLRVRAQKGQLVHLEVAPSGSERWPIVMGSGWSYLIGFPDQRVVAGATREDGTGLDAKVTAGGVQSVLSAAFELAPALATAALREVRTGFRPVSDDGRPILGACPSCANLFVATGHGGYGLELGPYSGALLADLVFGAPLALDLTAFGVARFAAEGPGGQGGL